MPARPLSKGEPMSQIKTKMKLLSLSRRSGVTVVSCTKDVDDKFTDGVGEDIYEINPDKCTECVGFHDEPQCAAVCPVDCCVDNDKWRDRQEELL